MTALFVASGCDSAVIQGVVLDARGQALPGVSVHTVGTPHEALTNGRGEYRVRFVPMEEFHVQFFKTGYTTGDLRIQSVTEARSVRANPISLISLPEGPGVYLSDNRFSHYERTTFDSPKQLARQSDESIVYGFLRAPIEIKDLRPFIVIYRGFTIPRCCPKLNALEETEVKVGAKEKVKAWVRAGEIPIEVSEVDVGQGQLLSALPLGELPFGAYAVHWGALDGDMSADEQRSFAFRIVEEFTPTEKPEEPIAPDAAKEVDKKAVEVEDTEAPAQAADQEL
ncbi:MAG: carboxypeptidase regulatory-like domain-containing protein [Candidatus Hydrogenedentes bacterium]|nr:carboxypeptidase regulatory-like domain-containing protein [Candidatus Hydrogenedentota bacterium]